MTAAKTWAKTWNVNRRTLLAGAVGTAATASLAACGGGGTQGARGSTGSRKNKVTLRVMANDAFARQWQEDLVPAFNEAYPHVNVRIDGVPYNDQLPKAMLELLGTDPYYDVVIADDPWIPQLMRTDALLDLKRDVADYTDPEYDWDDFLDAPLAAGQWNGRQYGVPIRSNLLLMFYNRKLYEKAGLPEPTPELTWDRYLAQAPKLVQDTSGDGKDDSWAVATYWTRDPLTPTIWQTVLNSNGGQLFDDEMRPQFDGPRGVAALQTQIDLLKWAPPGASTYQFNEPLEAFRQSKVATMFTWGSVYKGTVVDRETTRLTPDEVGLQVLPVGSAAAGSHRGIWTASVVKRSENREAAWKFIEWTTSKSGERFHAGKLGVFPARRSTLTAKAPEPWLEPVFRAMLDGYQAVSDGEMWRPRLPEADAVQQVLAKKTSEAVSGQASAKDALNQAAGEITKMLTSKGYYR